MLVEIRYIFFFSGQELLQEEIQLLTAPHLLSTVHGALILFLAGNCLSPTAYIAKHYLFNAANPPSGVTFSPWFCHFWETLAQEFPQANGTFHLCFLLVPTIFKASVSFYPLKVASLKPHRGLNLSPQLWPHELCSTPLWRFCLLTLESPLHNTNQHFRS